MIRAAYCAVSGLILATAASVWLAAGSPAIAQSNEIVAECEVLDFNGSTTVMVCPEARRLVAAGDDGVKALRAAGRLGCAERAPCIAWIWDDAKDAPDAAPPLSDDLTKAQVQSAIAVWINDADNLMLISGGK